MPTLKNDQLNPDELGAVADKLKDAANLLNRFMRDTRLILNGGARLSDNLVGVVKTITVEVPNDWVDLILASGWSAWNAGKPPQVRKTDDGELVFRRLARAPGTVPALFSSFATLPSTHTAVSGESCENVVTANGVFATVGVNGSGIFYTGGTFTASSWVSLSDVRAVAADRTPVPWKAPFPLEVALGKDFPGKPQHVFVTRVEGQPTGAVTPVWTPTTISTEAGQEHGIRITSFPGLTPTQKYKVTLFITL